MGVQTGRRRRLSDVEGAEAPAYKYANPPKLAKALSNDLIEQICSLFAKGYPLTAICDFVGLSDSTLQAWIRKGELARSGKSMPNEQVYLTLVMGLRRASAEWTFEHVESAQTGKDWYRHFRWLQVRDPVNFGEGSVGDTVTGSDPNLSFL